MRPATLYAPRPLARRALIHLLCFCGAALVVVLFLPCLTSARAHAVLFIRSAMGHKASLGHCGDRVRPAGGAEDGAGQPAALRTVPAKQSALRAAAADPVARTQGMPGCPPGRPAAQAAPAWAKAPGRAAHCAASAVPAAAAGQLGALAPGNAALHGARAVPSHGIVSATHAALVGWSAKLDEPSFVPPNGTHGRSLHIPASEPLGNEQADGSAAGARRHSCVGQGLQAHQGMSLGIPSGLQGVTAASLPVLHGWALMNLGPALAHLRQRDASSTAYGAAGRAACRPPTPKLALDLYPRAAQRPTWDRSPQLPRTVRSASGLRGQMLRGGARAAAPALVQASAAAPTGSAGLAGSRSPLVALGLYPTGQASTGPAIGALVADLAVGLAELRRLRSALTLTGSAARPRTAAKLHLPSLTSVQARRGSRTPRDARRSDHERGSAGFERGHSPAGYATGPPSARSHRAPRAGSAPPRRPAFGRVAPGRPSPPPAAAARPQQRCVTRPASVDGEPARRSGPACAVDKRRPAGNVCSSPMAVAQSPRTALAPAAPALQEQRVCIATVGGVAQGGYAPRYRMQAGPGAGAIKGAAVPRPAAYSRAPAALCAQPAADAGRHAAAPVAWPHVQAGRGDASMGGACAAAAAPPSSTRAAPSCSGVLSGRNPATAVKPGGEEQGSGSSARSSVSCLQDRIRGARGSDSESRRAAAGGAREGLCSSREHGSRDGIAEAPKVYSGSHSWDGRLVQQAGCAQSTSPSHFAALADGAEVPEAALSESSAGSADPGLAGLVCIRLGDGTRRSSDGGAGADMARAAEGHGAAAGAPAHKSLMEPRGPMLQPAHGHYGPGGGPPSLGAGAGLQVPQLAPARKRPAGMQAACSGQPQPPQQAGPEAAVSARGAAARAGPRLPVHSAGQSLGAGAGPELAGVPHAGGPPALLTAAALGAGPCPAARSADACQKVADWLSASAAPDRTAEAAGCAHASLPASEGSSEARASFESSAACSGAARIQGALPLSGKSAGLLTPARPAGQFPACSAKCLLSTVRNCL